MKKLGFLMLTLAIALMLGGTALAQDTDSYFLTYFSNNVTNAPDETVRLINDGFTEATIYADFYVFDDSEELTECCSCAITPDGLLSESVRSNLTANPITGIKPTRGVIKVIASTPPGAAAPGGPATGVNPTPGLHGWATHAQKLASGYDLTEGELADGVLSASEEALLEELCMFDGLLSGKQCTCTPEDMDF